MKELGVRSTEHSLARGTVPGLAGRTSALVHPICCAELVEADGMELLAAVDDDDLWESFTSTDHIAHDHHARDV